MILRTLPSFFLASWGPWQVWPGAEGNYKIRESLQGYAGVLDIFEVRATSTRIVRLSENRTGDTTTQARCSGR
jgi:hypothetical protein